MGFRSDMVWGEDESRYEMPEALRHSANMLVEITPTTLCGVYFLCRAGQVRYVGQATNALGRIREHRKDGRVFDAAYFLRVKPDQLDAVERHWIEQLRPPENIR